MALKIGMIGTNFISDDFCAAAAQVPGAELSAVYSRKQETGDAFAAKHNIPRVYTDYDEFLDSGLDAVYVASPNFAHCSQTLKALNHKKHVLCEKVMAVNEPEVRSMIDCARQNNVVLLEAMRPDFDPAYDLIEQNLPRIGKLRRATFEFCQYSSRYDSFREGIIQNAFNPELGNAAVMDIGVYCIHSLVRLFGTPKNIKAVSTKLSNGFDGSGIVLMEYEDMTAEAVYSKIAVSVTPSVLQGEDGSIMIDYISKPESVSLRLRESARDTLTGGTIEKLPYTPAKNNMIFEIQEFLKLIEKKEVDHKYLKYSLGTIRVLDEVRRQTGIRF
ncbi:MAG TPA: Gfo/Idh/MocA family oxidoreductase [Candidatus Mediterraneibacter caccavium]|uniref:Gfo/Idh/MocA family oxidoreductase n=1 Tax=Candidatus Mediterraneibacter caccavium TaxID=2838661 RepID=A0A9D2ARI4_9FIRM|nr:Gfo/Idh/MocA family oxidoreductase [Candidatus Mediterraneibacter caccavium]